MQNRDNLILMGDMDGDLQMADGINYLRNKVTIGFLNTKVNERSINAFSINFSQQSMLI